MSTKGRYARLVVAVLAATGLVAAMAAPASAGSWRQFHKDATHRGFSAEEHTLGVSNVGSIQLRWSADIGGEARLSNPVIANGRVFIGAFVRSTEAGVFSAISALDQATGRLLWRQEVLGYVDTPALWNGRLFVLTSEGILTAFRAWDGRVLWTETTTGNTLASPVIADGVLYVVEYSGLLALDPATGAVLWSRGAPATRSTPSVVGGRIYIIGSDNLGNWHGPVVVALDQATGARLWTRQIDQVQLSSPAVYGNRLYIGTQNDDGLWSLFGRRGVVAWHVGRGRTFDNTPAVDGERVYVGDYISDRVIAYDAVTGALIWASPHGGSQGSVIVANGVVWSAGPDGNLYGLDAATGATLVSRGYGESGYATPTIVDGVVYVASDSGTLMAFGLPA